MKKVSVFLTAMASLFAASAFSSCVCCKTEIDPPKLQRAPEFEPLPAPLPVEAPAYTPAPVVEAVK